MSIKAPAPPRTMASQGRMRPELAPIPMEAPQNLATSNQKRWVDLSFKVTEDERDAFRLEAAKRKMSHKELLMAALTLYREQFPVPER
jgi:hypothetical protein